MMFKELKQYVSSTLLAHQLSCHDKTVVLMIIEQFVSPRPPMCASEGHQASQGEMV